MTLRTRVVDVGITVGNADKERKMVKREAKKAEQQRYAHIGMSNGQHVKVAFTEEQVETLLEVLEEDAALVIIGTGGTFLRLHTDHIVSLAIGKTPDPECIVADEVY